MSGIKAKQTPHTLLWQCLKYNFDTQVIIALKKRQIGGYFV